MSAASDLISATPGMIFEYAGFDEPDGFKWVNGQALSRTTFARLFAKLTRQVTGTTSNSSPTVTGVSADLTAVVAIGMPISGINVQAGTTVAGITSSTITLSLNATGGGSVTLTIAPHGVGDGSTTFNVPDRRGRTGVGRDDMGGSAAGRMTTGGGGVNGALLGHAAGTQTHTLTAAQIPAITSSGTFSLSSGGLVQSNGDTTSFSTGTGGATVWQAFTNGSSQARVSPTASGSTSSTNTGGTAHPNVQPSYVCNYVIKT